MDFSLCDRSALLRCSLSLFLSFCLALPSLTMSAGEALTLTLTHRDELPQAVTSLKQLNARAGDMLSLSSELGEDFAFRVETARRTNHGNKVIRGVSEAGGRLTMVVTSDGQLQGYLREDGRTHRLVQEGGDIVWHYADPYLARPVDRGGVRLQRFDKTGPANESIRDLKRMERTALKDLSEETIHYPVFGSGMATLDVLFYHETGMQWSDSAPDGGRSDEAVGGATVAEQAGTGSESVYRHQNQQHNAACGPASSSASLNNLQVFSKCIDWVAISTIR